jgi:hypothetical protein
MQDGVYKQITIKSTFLASGYSGTSSEVTFFTGYCKFQVGQGREYFAAKQRHADLSALAQLTQYVHGVKETMVAYIDGLKYQIIAPPEGVRENNWLELKLKRVT